ncbi:MAG: cysteine hydrolase [Proteobacteria bacterium]|nr:MAG: cysteine hydrolase [Pseudomonadota bacterium]
MAKEKTDLNGNAPDESKVALLLVDVINKLDFPNASDFRRSFSSMSLALPKLIKRSRKFDVPVIYVNDNFGKWRSNFKSQIAECSKVDCQVRDDVLRLAPGPDDYYVLKPQHSAFYATPLSLLLESLKVETLIICGISAESCILFTATDAYVRKFKIVLASDCIVSQNAAKKNAALKLMKESLRAEVKISSKINFKKYLDD